MVRFRQKEYSGKTKKIVRGVLKAKDRIITKIDNAGLKAGEAIGYGKNTPGNFKFKPKSNRAINRETFETIDGAKETARKIMETPVGHGIDSGIKYAAGNPLTATSTLVPIPGTTIPAMAGETALKTKVPRYARITDRLQKGYERTKLSKGLKKAGGPSLMDLTNMIPIG